MVAVGVYLRLSMMDDEGSGKAVQRQEEDARALCKRLGWEVGGVYTDQSVSAYKRVVRPAWQQLLADLESGVIAGVVAYDIDRVARQPRDLEALLDLYERRELVFATVAGELDLSKADGRFIARLLVNVANKSSADTSRRVARSHLQLAQQGRPAGGGSRPFGYTTNQLEVVETEATVIRDAAERVLAGESLTSICRSLDGVTPTPKNARLWDRGVLKRILISPRIAGLRKYKGTVMLGVEAQWPAILDLPTWEAVRQVLTDPNREISRGRIDRQYLLSGFLRCPCGTKMNGATTKDGAVYRCPTGRGCGKTCRRAPDLDKHITELVLRYLERQEIPEAPPEDNHGIEEAEKSLAALIAEWSAGRMSDSVFFSAQAQKERQLTALKKGRARVRRAKPVDKSIRERWSESNLSQRRAILSEALVAVKVLEKPRNAPKRFLPQYYVPVWMQAADQSDAGLPATTAEL